MASTSVWTLEQRLALYILHTEFDLDLDTLVRVFVIKFETELRSRGFQNFSPEGLDSEHQQLKAQLSEIINTQMASYNTTAANGNDESELAEREGNEDSTVTGASSESEQTAGTKSARNFFNDDDNESTHSGANEVDEHVRTHTPEGVVQGPLASTTAATSPIWPPELLRCPRDYDHIIADEPLTLNLDSVDESLDIQIRSVRSSTFQEGPIMEGCPTPIIKDEADIPEDEPLLSSWANPLLRHRDPDPSRDIYDWCRCDGCEMEKMEEFEARLGR